jgi:hypothetical protein
MASALEPLLRRGVSVERAADQSLVTALMPAALAANTGAAKRINRPQAHLYAADRGATPC